MKQLERSFGVYFLECDHTSILPRPYNPELSCTPFLLHIGFFGLLGSDSLCIDQNELDVEVFYVVRG
jgi:hypothetical protein